MSTATNDQPRRSLTDRNARLTALAFVVSAFCAAILAIVAWEIALPQLRVFVFDHTESGSAIAWYHILDFARISSVLFLAVTASLIASRTVSCHSSNDNDGD
ncbi:MAG TPA: hypothetical protein DDW52_19915 [Planctomycetaceae bacterium]|nr:hypothetical protein [Planctomycetaceae bacterium]